MIFKLKDGTFEWRNSNGQLHRIDGPAVIYPNGDMQWYQYGNPHRTDGPSFISKDGTQYWHYHGVLHRTNGPAIVFSDDEVEYWLEGIKYDPVTFLINSYVYTKEI